MRYLNLPNIVSFTRILAAPFFYFLFISDNPKFVSIACWIFILASITDIIDGWAARRFSVVTRYGEFLDPLADKILTLLALIAFVSKQIIPLWMVLIILIRDILSTTLRIVALWKGSPIETSRSAKVKTTIEMLFISYVLVLIYFQINVTTINPQEVESIIHSPITYIIALIVTLMALYSLLGYLIRSRFLIKKLKKVEKIEKKLQKGLDK